MANNKVNMPSSGAGITRYFEDSKSNIEISPGQIIILCIVVIIALLILHSMGHQWFGI